MARAADRGYWTPCPETPSASAYGAGAPDLGEAAFRDLVDRPLWTAGHGAAAPSRRTPATSGSPDRARSSATPNRAWAFSPEPVRTGGSQPEAEPPAPSSAADRDSAEGGDPKSGITVVLDGRATAFSAPRDRTVLDSAQQTRPDLPFACEGGVCGTCRALVTHGAADMRHNYALEPAEVSAGNALTCQTFAVSDSLTVDFDR